MRTYIFTKTKRWRLRRWLETGEKDYKTRKLFVHVRRNVPQLRRGERGAIVA